MTIGTTTPRGFPYPQNDEPVTNGWDAIRDLAEAVDNDVDTRPRLLAYHEVQGPQSGITSAQVTGLLTAGLVIPAGRRIRVASRLQIVHLTTAGWDHLYIEQSFNGAAFAQVMESQETHSAGASYAMEAERMLTPAAGTYAYRVSFLAEAGTVTIGTAARQLWSTLAVWDDGAA